MNAHSRVTAFYSFKGGVGRTLALTNVAHQLAAAGLRVLMIDADIEAPGLSLWPEFQEALRGRSGEPPPGNVTDFLRETICYAEGEQEAPDLQRFIRCVWSTTTAHLSGAYTAAMISLCMQALSDGGRLDLLPCGAGDEYLRSINELDRTAAAWQQDAGDAERQNLRSTFNELLSAYDCVLVDTRTGLTPLTAFIIEHFVDNLVVVSGLNEQNLRGTEAVARGFLHRFCSKGERPRLCFVASPVPVSEVDLKHQRFNEFRRRILRESARLPLLEPVEVFQVQYFARIALAEEGNVVGRWPEEATARDYRKIFRWVIARAGFGLDVAERDLNVALEQWNRLATHGRPEAVDLIPTLRAMTLALQRAAASDPTQAKALASITAHRKFVAKRVHGSERGENLFTHTTSSKPWDAGTAGLRFPVLNIAARLDTDDTHLARELRGVSLTTLDVAAFLTDALRERGYSAEAVDGLTLDPVAQHTNVNYVWRLTIGGERLFVKHATPVVKAWSNGAPDEFRDFWYPTDRLDYEFAALRLFSAIRERMSSSDWLTPSPVLYDRGFSLLVMSDISEGRHLLAELLPTALPPDSSAVHLANAVGDVHRYSRDHQSVRIRTEAAETWIMEFIWKFKTTGARRVLGDDRVLEELRLASSRVPSVLLFVDLADKNIFAGSSDVALCDFEAVFRGDPAFDVGHIFGELLFWPVGRAMSTPAAMTACVDWLSAFFNRYAERMELAGSARDALCMRALQYAGVILLHRAAGASKKGASSEHVAAATDLGVALLKEAVRDLRTLGSYGDLNRDGQGKGTGRRKQRV